MVFKLHKMQFCVVQPSVIWQEVPGALLAQNSRLRKCLTALSTKGTKLEEEEAVHSVGYRGKCQASRSEAPEDRRQVGASGQEQAATGMAAVVSDP